MYIYIILKEYFGLARLIWRKISYFNTQIRVYHILFIDETTDYVAAEDFDSIDLILF